MNISLLELFNFIFALLSTGAIGTVVGIWYKSKRHEEIISELDQRTRNVPTLEQNMVRVVDLEERVKILESMKGTLKSIEVSMAYIKEQNMVRVVDLEERVKILESMNITLKSIEVSMTYIKERLNEQGVKFSKLDDRFNNHIHHNPRV